MATVQEGYNRQPLEIKVYKSHSNSGMAEIWTDMFDGWKYSETDTGQDVNDPKFRTEVLHYATLPELIQLRDEINSVIKEVAGV